jgi:hypothetical protein
VEGIGNNVIFGITRHFVGVTAENYEKVQSRLPIPEQKV